MSKPIDGCGYTYSLTVDSDLLSIDKNSGQVTFINKADSAVLALETAIAIQPYDGVNVMQPMITESLKVYTVCGVTSTEILSPARLRKVMDGTSIITISGEFDTTNEECGIASITLAAESIRHFNITLDESEFTVMRKNNPTMGDPREVTIIVIAEG